MHDLRRQALQGNKTVSRKARSRLASQQSSAGNSRTNSRNPSRQPSDDEEYGSDGTAWSTNSVEDVLNSEEVDATPEAWESLLEERMEELINRKRSSNEGRERCLAIYTHILFRNYAKDEIEGKLGELYPAFLKSIRSEDSEKETVLALKALSVTLITCPSTVIYESLFQPLQRIIEDSESMPSKVAAIQSLSTAVIFGGASSDEIENIMQYFIEIIESDGSTIKADDEGDVVAAALEEWGFLASHLDELEEVTETAMDAFVEQLESSDASVQIAAGENIALLYENSYTEQEGDEDLSEEDAESDPEDESDPNAPKMVKRYTVYRREDQLKHLLESLATVSGRGISKKDKKSLHTNFADILNSVEHPTRGPKYSNAVDHLTGKRYGSRMTVTIAQAGEMRIDEWSKLHRLKGLRRILQSGFITHYQENEVVFKELPVMLTKRR